MTPTEDGLIARIADRITRQAECLEGYAEKAGHAAKPVPSVFHSQAMHFRDLADELRAALNTETARSVPEFGDAGDALDYALGHIPDRDYALSFLDDWRADRAVDWPGYVKWLGTQRHWFRRGGGLDSSKRIGVQGGGTAKQRSAHRRS
jgi:hypothetical protein